MSMNKKLIGGQKMRELGSDRHTDDVDYIVYDESDSRLFIHDEDGVDVVNAAQHPFYSEVWNAGINEQTMLEMACFTFVQHCVNFNFDKADSKEYDIKFLVRLIGQGADVSIVRKYISAGEMAEIKKIIESVKF